MARNLIAGYNLDAGVQLLCLVGKHADAVQYLQVYERWEEAARLAKVLDVTFLL